MGQSWFLFPYIVFKCLQDGIKSHGLSNSFSSCCSTILLTLPSLNKYPWWPVSRQILDLISDRTVLKTALFSGLIRRTCNKNIHRWLPCLRFPTCLTNYCQNRVLFRVLLPFQGAHAHAHVDNIVVWVSLFTCIHCIRTDLHIHLTRLQKTCFANMIHWLFFSF